MNEPRRPGRFRLVALAAAGGAGAFVVGAGASALLARAGFGWPAAALAGAALALAAVVFAVRRLARAVRRLTEVAAGLAAGDSQVRPPRSPVSELDHLGAAVGAMASELGRRVAESEEERHTLEVVLGTLPQGVLLVGVDDGISYANPAAQATLGAIPDRLAGLAPMGLQRLVRDARREGWAVETELEHGAPVRRLRAAATPIRGADGRVLVVVSDVTERHRLEAMRRDFVADASHELKTPVAAILASAEALKLALGRDPARAARFADQLEESARRLASIVSDLLDLSRLEASAPERARLSLDRVVREEAARFRTRAEEAGVSLEVHGEEAEVIGSEADLALAVRNLVDNALRHTDRGGRVEVSWFPRGPVAVLEVADTGSGIPTRALPRVFERFFRVDVARSRATGGTGLGLAIVKHVAERHGGRVSVESQLGVGSTFRIELPLAG
jgi:signal transduction histidine kinase